MFIVLILAALLGNAQAPSAEMGNNTPSLPTPKNIRANAVFYDESDAKKVHMGRNYYPPEATAAKASGYAVVDCELKPNGKALRCTVVEETPPGMGFGKATALRVLKRTPRSARPSSTSTLWVRYTYRWDFESKNEITG